RIKELLYDEMFTIAGARKKLQADIRVDAPKLKIVHPEPADDTFELTEPTLFDGEIEGDGSVTYASEASTDSLDTLSQEKVDAIRQLSTHLMELREMLTNGRGK